MKLTDLEIEKLWDELEDIPIDENECLDVDWNSWSKGTHREEIWHWFDENHSKGVYWLMNERETKMIIQGGIKYESKNQFATMFVWRLTLKTGKQCRKWGCFCLHIEN